MPKPKPADIQGLPELKNAAISLKDTATGLVAMAMAVQESVDSILTENREQVRQHLERKDLRPKVNFKPLPKSQWAIMIGSDLYAIGPLPNFETIDEDQPRFYWQHGQGQPVLSISMFQALIGVMQHYFNNTDYHLYNMGAPLKHNLESATGNKNKPIDNPPS